MQRIAETPLAIIGMECRLPGADNLEEFWRLLIDGRSNLGELPPDRFDRDLHFHPEKGVRTKSYTAMGGVSSNRPFDRAACPLPQDVIDRSHQVHLSLLEVAASACRRAGLDPFALSNRNVGVYVGHTPPSALSGRMPFARQIAQTAQYLREVEGFDELTGGRQNEVIQEIIDAVRSEFPEDDPAFTMHANAYHASSLISTAFGLDGPAISFDAACASSLRALGHGVRALQLGDIDMAIIAGASHCTSDTLVLFSQAQSVSTSGSRPFDNDADGLIASDGIVVVVIKTLARAQADGDPILSVIRGLGISSDGKGKSLWAPRQEGQIEAIRRAYEFGVSQDELQYIEMHATSTQVGDATEIGALTSIFEGKLPSGKRIPVGSVKANVGHTLETAGLASLCKTVLSIQHGVIPPQINIQTLNEKINWDGIPFYVPQQALEWPYPGQGKPRLAAVNAFGIGGLNVHVVLEGYGPHSAPASAAPVPAGSASSAHDTPSPPHEPIAIIGMGAVFPGADSIEALFKNLRSGADQKREISDAEWMQHVDVDSTEERRWRLSMRYGAVVSGFEYDWKKHRVPPKQIASADPMQFMLLDAADQALRDAGCEGKNFNREKTGVIVGTIFGGVFTDSLQAGLRVSDFERTLTEVLTRRGVAPEIIANIYRQYEDILLKYMPALVDETGSFTSSTLASRITKTFDLMGGAVALDAGDTSAIAALSSSIDLLRAGDCDMMVCASGQMMLGCAAYTAMCDEGSLADGPSTPFDARATGRVPGEGVGVVVLKRLADAQRDGDRIHAVIHGVGLARNESLERGISVAIERGLKASGLDSNQVALVEAGAAGWPPTDDEEAKGLAAGYKSSEREQPLILGSAASQFGYCGGVSGMASLFKAVAELKAGSMPPIAGLEQSSPAVVDHADVLKPATERSSVPGLNDDGCAYAGVSAFSKSNGAYHLLLEGMTRIPRTQPEKPAQETTPATTLRPAASHTTAPFVAADSKWRIVRIGGESIAQVASKAALSVDRASVLFESSDGTSFTASESSRLAIVAESTEELVTKLTLAAERIQNEKVRPLLADNGIFYGEIGTKPARVAFLFPGQGSQYDGMLKSLVEEYPPAAAALKEVDAVFARLGLHSFSDLAWKEGNGLGTDVCRTQLSLLAADTIMYAAARAMGLKADRVSGHSFGELAALIATGSWTFESALRATVARCQAIDSCKDANGSLVSTSTPADVLEALCRQSGGVVYVSHRNAPDQTVAGGEKAAIARLAELIEREGYQSLILDVPAAFHTPLMEGVTEPFRRGLEPIDIEPPGIPLLSSVTNRYVAEPADIRENLVVQMTQPVNYATLIERLAREGISVFVEVGPRQVLTGLHKRIFDSGPGAGSEPGAGEVPPVFVSCDHSKRQGLQQLLFARACVETTGALDSELSSDAAIWGIASETRDPAEIDIPAEPAKTDIPDEIPGLEHDDRYHGLNVLRLSGSSFEMGRQHGQAQESEIKAVLRRYADLAGTRWDRQADLEAAIAHPETFFGPDELDELRGVALGAGVTMESVVAHNLRLYLDAGAGGLHFAVTARANPGEGLLHAVNEELRSGLSVRDCLERNIQVRTPAHGLANVTFGVAGQVGSLNGINVKGLAVSTAALLDVPKVDDMTGRMLHTVLIKTILERAETIEAAVDIIRNSRTSAAFNLCLSHHISDKLCYVEFDGESLKVRPTTPSVIAANHQLMIVPSERTPPQSSQLRLNRLTELLGGKTPDSLSVSKARQALRDRFDPRLKRESENTTVNTLMRVDNQISILMQPAKGNIWVTGGPCSNGHQNQFSQLNLNDLLGDASTQIESEASPAASSAPVAPSVSEGARLPSVDADDLIRAYADAENAVANAEHARVCDRFVMRVVEKPLNPESIGSPVFNGAVLVVGHNVVARALREKLAQCGAKVVDVPNTGGLDETLAAVDRIWESTPAPHLFIATAFDDEAVTTLDENGWRQRRNIGVMVPYFIAQRWFTHLVSSGLQEKASIVALTSMGGDFGLSGRLTNVESGALAGLVKGIHLELLLGRSVKNFRAKIVDAPSTTNPNELAEQVCRELAVDDSEIEVGYHGARRYVVRPIAEPVTSLPQTDIPAGTPFVITGGARGVTAVVARELGSRYGVKLHLIGSSPAAEIAETYHELSDDEMKEVRALIAKEALADGIKPVDAWARFDKSLEVDRTLRSFAAAGIQATYHSCDISDRRALAALLETIRAADGPIGGIVHGAGFERAASFEKKKPELVDRTIAAKVDGAAALMELTAQDPIKYFATFGSVSGRFGGVGQTDYCVANEMLAKLVNWYRGQRPECPTTLFHWHAWDDVGMAVRPESKHIRKLHNINFMPSAEGANHLLDELKAGLPEGEILITELNYCREKYADTVASGNASAAQEAAVGVDNISDPVAALPMIDTAPHLVVGRELTAGVHLNPTSDLFLLQHRFRGRPLMPVVVSLESMAQAASLVAGPSKYVAGLKEIEILNGLRFHNDDVQQARILAAADGDLIACAFTCDFHNRSGKLLLKDKPYLKCTLDVCDSPPGLESTAGRGPAEWTEIWYPEEDNVIYHGTEFRCLTHVAVEEQLGWGMLTAPETGNLGGNRTGDGWIMPMALLDGCFFACGVYLWLQYEGVVAIPSGIDDIRLGRPARAGEQCVVHMNFRGKQDDQGIFDFVLYGEDGTAILQLEGYRNVIVSWEPSNVR